MPRTCIQPETMAVELGPNFRIMRVEQQLRNLRFNVLGLRDSLTQLTELYEAGRIANPLQVEQARQALYNVESQLLTTQAGYESRLDPYKVQLGLPPDLPVAINDKFLDRFRLIDDSINQLQDDVGDLLDIIRAQRGEIDPAVIDDVLAKSFAFRKPMKNSWKSPCAITRRRSRGPWRAARNSRRCSTGPSSRQLRRYCPL
jgi:hypothetical protein